MTMYSYERLLKAFNETRFNDDHERHIVATFIRDVVDDGEVLVSTVLAEAETLADIQGR